MTSTNKKNQQTNKPTNQATSKPTNKQILFILFVLLSCLFSAALVYAATASIPAATLNSVTITDSASKNTPPHAVIKYTENGNTVNFDASGSNDSDGSIADYKWDFGDGTTGAGVTVSHVYSGYGNFPVTLAVVDNKGGVALSQVSFKHNKLQIESGEVSLDDKWQRVSFATSFVDPVVVAKPPSHDGPDPCVIRIRNVDSSGFDIRIQEWDYLDGVHAMENVSYVVIEKGKYTLADGTRVEAGLFATDSTEQSDKIAFTQTFNVVPVVTTSVLTMNEVDTVAGRLANISTTGFEYRMQEQEANAQTHAQEKISYIAWEPSSGTVGKLKYEVNRTNNVVTNNWHSIVYQGSYQSVPAFVADMQTFNGIDSSSLRYQLKDKTHVQVMVEEEKSKDSETKHIAEVVGYMILEKLQ